MATKTRKKTVKSSIYKISKDDIYENGTRVALKRDKLKELEKKISQNSTSVRIDAKGVYYRVLNQVLRQIVNMGAKKISLTNVYGQRYIGTDLKNEIQMTINGTPGNDLGVFMDGPRIVVRGNAQDCCGNTMNSGEIIIHGHAGDILGMAMRGGRIFVKEDVGYRAAIHMKDYEDKIPVVVIGGTAQDFFGEYMAGGRVILLGLNLKKGENHKAHFIGTGMHGGVIYIRGSVDKHQLGKEVSIRELNDEDTEFLKPQLARFAKLFSQNLNDIYSRDIIKLLPTSKRPYGRIYAY